MIYKSVFTAYDDKIILLSDGANLTGLYFYNQKNLPGELINNAVYNDSPDIFINTKKLLSLYFSGEKVSFSSLPLKLRGSGFRLKVWEELKKIPYGETLTYKDIALQIDKNMSAQAVGGAVSHNPISLIIPCHRVIGSDGKITGYAGGTDRKIKLLRLEGVKI